MYNNMFLKRKVYRMGNGLGIHFPKKMQRILGFNKGEYVKLQIKYKKREAVILSKFSYTVGIPRVIIDKLGLGHRNEISVEIEKLTNLQRTRKIFLQDKMDILFLIPEKTSLGYEIIVDEFERKGEKWLRYWYPHSRQIEIRRFINISVFGKLLGQIQAEGSKSGNKDKLEFSNELITEHKDFIAYLEELGINKKELTFKLTIQVT